MESPAAPRPNWLRDLVTWYLSFAIPGLGLFSEAYIIFSVGQLQPFQQVMFPACFVTFEACDEDMVEHVADYIQICGIIAGMLLWGYLADVVGRKWGSRSVATIMLSGVILLTFTVYAPSPSAYFAYFMVAQTWYGFGVGGEYPLAAASAAERSATDKELQKKRGQTVVLVFSNQGVGNVANIIVILIAMAIFGQTGDTLARGASKSIVTLMYGVGAVVALVMVVYRWMYLEESELFVEEEAIEHHTHSTTQHHAIAKQSKAAIFTVSMKKLWHRQVVASGGWFCNDFAFYGNKLQQSFFIGLLYPDANLYQRMQWTLLNGFVSLIGYYFSAYFVDKPWFGRRVLQTQGFMWMFVLFIIIYAQWENMAVPGAPIAGTRAFQALYYLSSFFNQFGPNCSTFLVAGEMFPTDVRATNHGFAAAMGKAGAIIASLWISYISDSRKVFLISAMFGLGGALLSLILLPDTTGLNLEEYDRMQRCLLEGRWDSYHGEAINPKHLSLFERFVLRWDRNYNPEKDRAELRAEVTSFMQHATDLKHPSVDGIHQYMRNPLVAEGLPEEFMRISEVAEQAAASGVFPHGGSSMVRRSMPSEGKLGRV